MKQLSYILQLRAALDDANCSENLSRLSQLTLQRLRDLILLLALALGLSGCEMMKKPRSTGAQDAQRVQVADSEAALALAPNVVDAFYQLPYDLALAPGDKAKYDHVAGLPVMYIDGHRTFVKGFQLGAQGEMNTLVIKSHFWRSGGSGMFGGMGKKKQPGVVLFPSVLLLSDQFQPLADIKRPDFNYPNASVLNSGPSALSQGMTVSINLPDIAQRATYMVLYVSPENRYGVFHYCRGGTGMVRFNSSSIPAYGGLECQAVPLGMEGSLEVSMQ